MCKDGSTTIIFSCDTWLHNYEFKSKSESVQSPVSPVLPVISVLLIYQCENLHTITEKVSRKSLSVDKTDTFGNLLINYSKK